MDSGRWYGFRRIASWTLFFQQCNQGFGNSDYEQQMTMQLIWNSTKILEEEPLKRDADVTETTLRRFRFAFQMQHPDTPVGP